MTIIELIRKLQEIEDKTLPVCIVDTSEDYLPPEELDHMAIRDDFYTNLLTHKSGKFLCLGAIK